MKKVMFLDFDGVLASKLENTWNEGYRQKMEIRRAIEISKCHVVISSSYRLHNSEELITKVLVHTGVISSPDVILGITPVGNYRGDEIRAWLSQRDDVESYVIVDDRDKAVFCSKLSAHRHIVPYVNSKLLSRFVQPDMFVGCTRANSDQIINLFKG